MNESDCRTYTLAWANSMPDPVVADQVADDEGIVTSACLPNDRLVGLVENDHLEIGELSDDLRIELVDEEGLSERFLPEEERKRRREQRQKRKQERKRQQKRRGKSKEGTLGKKEKARQ